MSLLTIDLELEHLGSLRLFFDRDAAFGLLQLSSMEDVLDVLKPEADSADRLQNTPNLL